jgi:hypothetical protein
MWQTRKDLQDHVEMRRMHKRLMEALLVGTVLHERSSRTPVNISPTFTRFLRELQVSTGNGTLGWATVVWMAVGCGGE